jgi:preprotein translocase subunit YajC
MTPILLQAGAGGGLLDMMPMMLGILVIMYFIVLRPQQKEKKKMEALRAGLKKGDRVMTQGGILAKVQQVKDKEVVLDLDGSSRMTVLRAAIQTIFADGAPAESKEKERETAAKA